MPDGQHRISPEDAALITREVIDKLKRESRLSQPRFHPGVVTAVVPYGSGSVGHVKLDGTGASAPIPAVSIIGFPIHAGDRVMVQFDEPQGAYIVGFQGQTVGGGCEIYCTTENLASGAYATGSTFTIPVSAPSTISFSVQCNLNFVANVTPGPAYFDLDWSASMTRSQDSLTAHWEGDETTLLMGDSSKTRNNVITLSWTTSVTADMYVTMSYSTTTESPATFVSANGGYMLNAIVCPHTTDGCINWYGGGG